MRNPKLRAMLSVPPLWPMLLSTLILASLVLAEIFMWTRSELATEARSLTYKALFDRRSSDATTTRVAACAQFDSLWHAAHVGDFPEPRFEPQVDTSSRERAHQEHRAGAKRKLEQLRSTIGVSQYDLLEKRIIHNLRYTTLAQYFAMGRNRLPAAFVEATDALVGFFGLAEAPDRARIEAYRLEATLPAPNQPRWLHRPASRVRPLANGSARPLAPGLHPAAARISRSRSSRVPSSRRALRYALMRTHHRQVSTLASDPPAEARQ